MSNANPHDVIPPGLPSVAPQGLPSVAVIFLHPKCNMTCSFCITEDHFDVMSEAQAHDLIKTLKKENFDNIVFGGGEPFEWPGDLIDLTQRAKKLGFLVQVGTNAIALPQKYEGIKSIDRYVLPLESVESAVHNKMRFHDGHHHQLIISCLQRLRCAQKSVTISTIIAQVNKNELKGLAEFLKGLNAPRSFIHAWHLYKFLPEGRGGKTNADKLMISDAEYAQACDAAKAVGLPFPVYRRKDMYRSKSVDFFWYERGQLQRASANRRPKGVQKMTVPFVYP